MIPGLLPLFSLLGSLEVTAGTPDALCPSTQAAEVAIAARVGVLEGDYRLHYELIRSADTAETLHLELREGSEKLLLSRDISLGTDGCSEAAQAIALVLERYFERLDRPAESAGELVGGETAAKPNSGGPETSEPAPEPNRETPGETTAAAPSRELVTSTSASTAAPREDGPPNFWLRLHGSVNEEAEPELGAGFTYATSGLLRLQLDVSLPLLENSETSSKYSVSSRRVALYPGLHVRGSWPSHPDWSFGVGPIVPLEFEWASSSGLLESGPGFRVIPGFGFATFVDYRLGKSLAVELAFRMGKLFSEEAKHFEVLDPGGQPIAVLERAPLSLAAQLTFLWGFPSGK